MAYVKERANFCLGFGLVFAYRWIDMMQFLSDLLGKKKPKDYAEQRAALRSADSRTRMSLAKDSQTSREFLYYLAEKDPDPKVREAVAKNKAMPVQVSPVLAMDSSSDPCGTREAL